MAQFSRLASVAELPPGSVRELTLDGRKLAVCNVGGELRAIGGSCAHRGGPLGQGVLQDDLLICPWHAWGFDTRTGASDVNPEIKVPTYECRVEAGELLVRAPD
jgi:nitrite reductase/ring-hydroxylating ferredoxin subunit